MLFTIVASVIPSLTNHKAHMTTLEMGFILDAERIARLVCVGIVLPAHFAVQDSTA